MKKRFYGQKTDAVTISLSVMDAKALRNQLRSLPEYEIVSRVLSMLGEQITKAERC